MGSIVTENFIVGGVEKQAPDGYCRSDMMRRHGIPATVVEVFKPKKTVKGPVMSVLMYSAKTAVDLGKLESFHMRCERQLLNIHWSGHVINKSVCELTRLSGEAYPLVATLHGCMLQSLQMVHYD